MPRSPKRPKPAAAPPRPPFIIATADAPERFSGPYPKSDEHLVHTRAVGRMAGLLKIGLHIQRIPPGHRTSWPHAESAEEEFVYVLSGQVDAWIDGVLHPMQPGDLAAFPAGTGICHCILNNSDAEAVVMVGGEATKAENRIYYPLHPGRAADMPWSHWWQDIPLGPQGPHDGLPNGRRAGKKGKAKAAEKKKRRDKD